MFFYVVTTTVTTNFIDEVFLGERKTFVNCLVDQYTKVFLNEQSQKPCLPPQKFTQKTTQKYFQGTEVLGTLDI